MVTKEQRRFAASKRRKAAQVRKARSNIAMGDGWKKATLQERNKLLKILKKDIIEARKDSHAARKSRREVEALKKQAFKERRAAAKLRRMAALERRKAVAERKKISAKNRSSKV